MLISHGMTDKIGDKLILTKYFMFNKLLDALGANVQLNMVELLSFPSVLYKH